MHRSERQPPAPDLVGEMLPLTLNGASLTWRP